MNSTSSRKRYKQLLERKRQARRRLVLRRVAGGLLILAIAGVLTIAIASVRSCVIARNGGHNLAHGKLPQPTPQPKADPAQSKISLVYAHDFRPGPQFVALDSQRVYVGANDPGTDKTLPSTLLAAFNFDGRDALWQAPAQSPLMQLGVSGGNIIGVPQGEGGLQRYDGVTGQPLAEIEASPEPEVQFDGRQVITGYKVTKDNGSAGARLTAYEPKTGERLWTTRPKLAGLLAAEMDACCGSAPQLELNCWSGVCGYRLHNVFGLLNTKGGKLLRAEYASGGHIVAAQLDRHSKSNEVRSGLAYIISADESDPNLYRLIRIPLDSDLKPRRLLEFRSQNSDFLLLADGGKVLLAFHDEDGKAKLACFAKGATAPTLSLDAAAGVTDMAAVPGSGDFLVATCERFKDGEPLGRSQLLRVRLGETPDALKVGGYGKPVLWVVPFKRDCLALVRGGGLLGGGQILRYSADSGKLKLLRRAKYELLEPQHSADQTALLVSSYPPSYALDKGGPLQVLVFK
jgi:hypothetical protein